MTKTWYFLPCPLEKKEKYFNHTLVSNTILSGEYTVNTHITRTIRVMPICKNVFYRQCFEQFKIACPGKEIMPFESAGRIFSSLNPIQVGVMKN